MYSVRLLSSVVNCCLAPYLQNVHGNLALLFRSTRPFSQLLISFTTSGNMAFTYRYVLTTGNKVTVWGFIENLYFLFDAEPINITFATTESKSGLVSSNSAFNRPTFVCNIAVHCFDELFVWYCSMVSQFYKAQYWNVSISLILQLFSGCFLFLYRMSFLMLTYVMHDLEL